ncbi:MAG: hypothetical protein EAY75_13335 [Bacteroidetes bacterium]|nr:MAG: hypothetical protein EAY75_13335 [Bacteroidota bacterium]
MIILALLWCQLAGLSQQIGGFYTGQLKMNGASIGAQMDLIVSGDSYTGILRTRYLDNNLITGCDNVLEGELEGKTLNLKMKVVIKETGVDANTCYYFTTVKLRLKTDGQAVEAVGNLLDQGGMTIGRLTLNRVDTALSFTAGEELQEASRRLKEESLRSIFDPKAFAETALEVRETNLIDSIEIEGKEVVMKFESPIAERLFKISVLVNGDAVMVDKAPGKAPFQITLKDMVVGETMIYIICHNLLQDFYFPTTVRVSFADKSFLVNVPVSTLQNQAIKLIRPIVKEHPKP